VFVGIKNVCVGKVIYSCICGYSYAIRHTKYGILLPMARTVVGILRGGTSSEYNLSLKTGAVMLSALPEERYETKDILIDKAGMWHMRGIPADPVRALSHVDVVLNALHGGVGEDGTVQRLLERAGVPYAGSRPLPAALSLNKIRARELFRKAGIPTPRGAAFSLENPMGTDEMSRAVFSQFGPPYIVKPPMEGAGSGILFAPTILELPEAIGDLLDKYGAVLIEEYLLGDETTVGVVEDFRGEQLYALPPAHIKLPDGHKHLAYHHHDEGLINHLVPSHFSHALKEAVADVARAAHRILSLGHFSRADIIITRQGPRLLEVNANPGLYSGAAFPPMLESVGSSTREFLEHAINLAKRA